VYVGDGCGDVFVVCMRLSCESFEDEKWKKGRFTTTTTTTTTSTTTTFSPINLVNMQTISFAYFVIVTFILQLKMYFQSVSL
jgi:hypothetical protein